jgi:Domain of unknown function (DUF4296)
MRNLIIAVVALGICGCNDPKKVPGGILKPEAMQAVLWDMMKADVYTTDYLVSDSQKNATLENAKLQQQIFLIHNTTRETYQKSFDYYQQHPELMRPVLDTITARIERRKSRVDTGNTGGGVKLNRDM